MSRSHFYHIDAMVNSIETTPETQPTSSRPPRGTSNVLTASPSFTKPIVIPTMTSTNYGDGIAIPLSTSPTSTLAPALSVIPELSVQSITPVISAVSTRPTVTVPISDVVPVTVTIPTTPTYGGGGGGGAINTAKPQTKELTITPTKPSFLKRNLLPILLIGSAVFILIKKPIK